MEPGTTRMITSSKLNKMLDHEIGQEIHIRMVSDTLVEYSINSHIFYTTVDRIAKYTSSEITIDILKQKTVDVDGCWVWQGRKSHGYAVLWYKKQNMRIHRLVWELVNGSIPDKMCVCHKCDNPSCINPDHLFIGTRNDNNQDKMKKGRFVPRGKSTKIDDPVPCKYLNLSDMSEQLGISYNELYQRIHLLQHYGAFRFGGNGRWMITQENFDRFIRHSDRFVTY